MLPDLKAGDTLTSDWLNELRGMALALLGRPDGSSGLAGYVGSVQALYAPRNPPRWAQLIAAGAAAGAYTAMEKVPSGVNGWDDGITFECREPNGTTGLAGASTPFVRCTYNVAFDEWTFEITSC